MDNMNDLPFETSNEFATQALINKIDTKTAFKMWMLKRNKADYVVKSGSNEIIYGNNLELTEEDLASLK